MIETFVGAMPEDLVESLCMLLGLATKAVNLRAVQAVRGDLTLVITQNAERNDNAVTINERMEFRPRSWPRVESLVGGRTRSCVSGGWRCLPGVTVRVSGRG